MTLVLSQFSDHDDARGLMSLFSAHPNGWRKALREAILKTFKGRQIPIEDSCNVLADRRNRIFAEASEGPSARTDGRSRRSISRQCLG